MSAQDKLRAITAIRDAIKVIDRERREPDPWEKYQLTLALGSALRFDSKSLLISHVTRM